MHEYFVYMLRCSDESYYIGITNNVEKRVNEHQEGTDIKCYTFRRRPIKLIYVAEFREVTDAIAWEKTIKGWSRKKKEALMQNDSEALHLLSQCQNGTHSIFKK